MKEGREMQGEEESGDRMNKKEMRRSCRGRDGMR